MPSLVFNDAKLKIIDGTYNLTTSDFYAVLVTSEPIAAVTLRSGLTEASGGNYAPLELTGRAIALNATTGAVTLAFNSPIWANLTTAAATPLTGMVICKRVGVSPATNDPVILSLVFSGSSYTPNGATFSVQATNNIVLTVQ